MANAGIAVSANTRETILREMGLTPIWIARTQTSTTEAATQTEPVAPPAPQSVAVRAVDADVSASNTSTAERAAKIGTMSWDELVQSISRCTACKLCKTRTNTVPGVGDRSPSWMIIGEAPGENEDKRGEPFVGKAGQLLDAMLAAIGKKRGDGIYIANVVKCRPPGNRNPESDEISACTPYLQRQIALAQPKLLLAAGKFAAQTLLSREDSVGAMRASGGHYESIPVVVTYHPSYLLRAPLEKAKAWDDLMKARAIAP